MANESVSNKIRADQTFSTSITIAAIFITATLVLGSTFATVVYASESNSKRYNDGYNEGYGWYANHPNDGPNNCDPDSLYTSGGGHTSTYCNGWYDGYTAASNGNNSPQGNYQPPQGNYQPPQTTPPSNNGYSLTVNIVSHAFGNPTVNVEAKTANGNYDQTYSVNIQNPSVSFSIPPDSGPSVQVCVTNSGIIGSLTGRCQIFDASGSDMTVNMSP